MDKFKVTIVTALVMTLLVVNVCAADLPKPSYARTMLKVSRSLPGETEELKVRTSEGNMATLIVKRRDRTIPEATRINEPPKGNQDSVGFANTQETRLNVSEALKIDTETKEETRELEKAQIEQLRAKLSDSDNRDAIETTSSTGKGQPVSEKNIDYGNWTPLDTEGRAVQLQESTTEEYRSWKPLQRDLQEERTNFAGFEPVYPESGLLLTRQSQDRSLRNVERSDQSEERTRYMFLPHQVRSTRTNIGANLSKNREGKNVPPEVIVRSEINVKSGGSGKRSPMTLDNDGTPVIHGKRVPDEPIDKIQTWRNARVINNKLIRDGTSAESVESPSSFYPAENSVENQRFDRFFKNVNRSPISRYGKTYEQSGKNVYFEWDPSNYKNEALKAEIYESRADSYRNSGHKRMLHPDTVSSYPVSRLYTPESPKIAPVALKPGARAPVLQYAHPELGVQPAKIVKNEKRKPDNFPENQYSFTEQRQKKKYVLNDKNIVDTYTTKNYYPNQHFYGLKRPNDAPFWVKISENLKSQFSNSVEKVSQFTRPVIDPLVEATHKISQNLGLSKGKEAEDKIGTVSTGGSILIPALGLVASGAALGIGAVAVGRYLDVDVLRRSNEGLATEVEYQRALDDSQTFLRESDQSSDKLQTVKPLNDRNDVLIVLEEIPNERGKENNEQTTNPSRRKRGLDYLDRFQVEGSSNSLIRNKRLQRKGADSMSEIVEIDLPAREGSIDITEFLIPKRKTSGKSNTKKGNQDSAILIVEDSPLNSMHLKNAESIAKNSMGDETKHSVDGRDEKRRRRSPDNSDQELEEALQNLENAEISQVSPIDGDWTNTPCAKRLFCDGMIQRGSDAIVTMEKKMAAVLGLIQSRTAVEISSHFQEVMDAVRRHDCSTFLCPRARPSLIF